MRDVLWLQGKMGFADFTRAFHDLLSALAFLHRKSMLHRDVKPENIYWDRNARRLKLGDFGLTRKVSKGDGDLTPRMVTRWYRSPELLREDEVRYDGGVDVYAAALTAAELLCGVPFAPGDTAADQLHLLIELLGDACDDVQGSVGIFDGRDAANQPSPRRLGSLFELVAPDVAEVPAQQQHALVDLLARLLSFKPAARLTAGQALEHPFFSFVASSSSLSSFSSPSSSPSSSFSPSSSSSLYK